jgi:outer membrane immunogenic protein
MQTEGLVQSWDETARWDETAQVGWTAGTGVEYAVTDHIIAGLEYNYYEFPTVTLVCGINPVTITSRQSVNAVVARAGYKF